MSIFIVLGLMLMVALSAIIQIFVDPRITTSFVWKTLLAMALLVIHIGTGAVVLKLLMQRVPDAHQDQAIGWAMLAMVGWIALGFFALLRHVPRTEDPPKWMMRFGVPDSVCFAAIIAGLTGTARFLF